MKIMPINNINVQNTQFKAKFPKQDINEFLREVEEDHIDIIPRIYTMLDVIKKQKGNEAKIEHIGLWHRILIDGKSLSGTNKYFSAYHALFDATVKTKSAQIKESMIKWFSEKEFENEYYKNSNKTVNSITTPASSSERVFCVLLMVSPFSSEYMALPL